MRASTGTLPPPSPLSVAMDPTEDQSDTLTTQPEDQNDATTTEPEDPLADIPELHTYVATDQEERTAALRLVADSIAQMRQAANNSLIFNPLNMAILVAVFAVVARFMIGRGHEPFIVGTTCTGILCIELVLIRNLTQEYLSAAEEINWAWLGDADLIVTKFGDEIIGTAVVNWVSGESRQKRKKAWRGEIRSWTVRLRYRGKGVGTALLEQAIKESKSKGAEGIDFADYHASKLSRCSFGGRNDTDCSQIRSVSRQSSIAGNLTRPTGERGRSCKICSRPVRRRRGGREVEVRRRFCWFDSNESWRLNPLDSRRYRVFEFHVLVSDVPRPPIRKIWTLVSIPAFA